MKANSNTRPLAVRIENLGETSDVILAENIEVIAPEGDKDESYQYDEYQYDEYRMNVVSRDNLLESVTNDFESWIQFMKLQITEPVQDVVERVTVLEEAVHAILTVEGVPE